MGQDKTLLTLAGEPLICHAVRAFELCREVDEIVVVTARERLQSTQTAIAGFSKCRPVIAGGENRQDSVRAGVQAVSDRIDWVAVHDGARPLVTDTMIRSCIDMAILHGGAALAEPVTDTLQRVNEDQFCLGPVDRSQLWRLQTPQIFRRDALLEVAAALQLERMIATDETSAFTASGHPVRLVENTEWNFKVTLPRDVRLAEFILQSRAAESLT
jgi:2-C-methyl-D-erythritol 4-phosphate cytidylyltransferase